MARQKLGQHFLASGKILERIARAACGDSVDFVLEIGPGRGALTERLLERAERVAAIELDSELAALLRKRWGEDSRFQLIHANALDADWTAWGQGVLAGNLPYYVASALITSYAMRPGQLRLGVFLIQKEVAERITSQPGHREYGYLSVVCQFFAKVEMLFSVPPGAFQPPPKVDSAVIRLTPRAELPEVDRARFTRFVGVCFQHK
ncbi:MAG TPA: 16S rRNA (adenine(1518)-N(6)/adenine(1519)-N(6))-dimethyltransferase RsmA, partial [Bryobacteraceae bacterium]|nr:16S rRNA (adenine(1518)-N(6)/adenine(1519)-N(6))-dimethyltransferase RsmA [Bryobacteraceae bacterium]